MEEKFLEEINAMIKPKLDEIKRLEKKLRTEKKELRTEKKEAERLKNELKKQADQNKSEKQVLENTIQFIGRTLVNKEQDIEALKQGINERNHKLKELENLLKSTPSFYGHFLRAHEDKTMDVLYKEERVRVDAIPEIDVTKLKVGQKLRLIQFQGAIVVVMALDNDYQFDTGEQVTLKGFLDNNRIIVDHRTEQRVLMLAEPLLKIKEELEIGDKILFDYHTGFAFAKLPKSEIEQIELETIPNVTWDDIGGLNKEIKRIKDEIELPYLYPEEYDLHKVTMPKGVLLFGPPGNGKTMLGKALANYLIKEFAKKLGKKPPKKGSFFLIKGPELSSKWVGVAEEAIREAFKKASQRYKEIGIPVVLFFDEADSFLPRRGSKISSDATDNYVTQFCEEIDGVEELEGVIVVLSTNRIEMLDDAVVRPGRMDFKIRIGQPNEKGAKAILAKYLVPDLPFDHKYKKKKYEFEDGSETANYLIEKVVERIYSQKPEIQAKNRYVELSLSDGKSKILYFKDFVSGAALKNIVDKAKKKSIRNSIDKKGRGIKLKMLYESIEKEFQENEGLPSSRKSIEDWLEMQGKRVEITGKPKFLTRELEEKSKKTRNRNPDIL